MLLEVRISVSLDLVPALWAVAQSLLVLCTSMTTVLLSTLLWCAHQPWLALAMVLVFSVYL